MNQLFQCISNDKKKIINVFLSKRGTGDTLPRISDIGDGLEFKIEEQRLIHENLKCYVAQGDQLNMLCLGKLVGSLKL